MDAVRMGGLRDNNRTQWEKAYNQLYPIAYASAARRLNNHDYAHTLEDVVIETIADAATAVFDGRVRDWDHLKAFVALVARRKAIDCFRRLQARRSGERLQAGEEPPSPDADPLDRACAIDLAAKLAALMRSALTPLQFKALHAFYFDGLSYEQVAVQLEQTTGWVGVTLCRAITAMRRELNRYPELINELREPLR